MISWRRPMPSISNDMTNIKFLTSFGLVTRCDCIFKKSASEAHIGRSNHSDMGLTPSQILWVTMLLNWVFLLSSACIWYLMWSYFNHISHLYWTPWRWLSKWPLHNTILTEFCKLQWMKSWTPGWRALTSITYNSIRLSKQDNYFRKESDSPRFRFRKKIPVSWGKLTQWGPILHKVGALI